MKSHILIVSKPVVVAYVMTAPIVFMAFRRLIRNMVHVGLSAGGIMELAPVECTRSEPLLFVKK
jgi:hypothetical protein